MTCTLSALCVEARDPRRVGRFWAGLLGWETAYDESAEVLLTPTDDTGFGLRFTASDEPKVAANLFHPDLTSTSLDDQRQTVQRALDLGAHHLDIGQGPDEPHVVLADPEGNELWLAGG